MDKRRTSQSLTTDDTKKCVSFLRIEFQCVGLRIDKVRSKSSEEKYIIKLDEDVIFAKDKVNFEEELKYLIISNEKINDG